MLTESERNSGSLISAITTFCAMYPVHYGLRGFFISAFASAPGSSDYLDLTGLGGVNGWPTGGKQNDLLYI